MFPFPIVLAFFLGYAFGAGTTQFFARDRWAWAVVSTVVVVAVVGAVAPPSVAYRAAWWVCVSLVAAAGTRLGQGPI